MAQRNQDYWNDDDRRGQDSRDWDERRRSYGEWRAGRGTDEGRGYGVGRDRDYERRGYGGRGYEGRGYENRGYGRGRGYEGREYEGRPGGERMDFAYGEGRVGWRGGELGYDEGREYEDRGYEERGYGGRVIRGYGGEEDRYEERGRYGMGGRPGDEYGMGRMDAGVTERDYGGRGGYGRYGEEREFRGMGSRDDTRWGGAGMRAIGYGMARTDVGERRMGRGPKGYRRSDERIREDVCDRLMQSWMNAENVDVHVRDCEVTLLGTVDSREEKRAIEDVAEGVLGVREVHNQLRVRRPGERTGTQGRDTQVQPPNPSMHS